LPSGGRMRGDEVEDRAPARRVRAGVKECHGGDELNDHAVVTEEVAALSPKPSPER